MFKQWWFRLYTKHYLLDLLKMTAISIVVDLAMTNFAGPFKYFAAFAVAGPVMILFMKGAGSSLRGNIEFHKMSMPFPELKKALAKDIVVSITATFASCFLVFISSILFGGIYSTKIGRAFINLVPPGIAIYSFLITFLLGCYLLIINKDRKYLMVDRGASKFKNLINFAVVWFLSVVYIAFMMAVIPAPEMIGFLFPGSICIGALLFHQKAIFHQYRPKGRMRDFAKFWSYGAATCCVLYFLCLPISRNDVLNDSLHPYQRAHSFVFNSRYNPEIDIETFKDIEKFVAYDGKQNLYESLKFDPYTLGLEYYLDEKDPYNVRLVELLRYSKPGPEFLIVLYDHFEKKPEYWKEKKNFGMVQFGAFAKWPKNETLPERFIVAKQSSKELFKKEVANNKAKAKARRELASKQEEE